MDTGIIYTALPSSGHYIRLLRVREASHLAEKLICELRLVDLTKADCPYYAALSYVWGDPSVAFEEIVLDNQCQRIGINLAMALRFFRGRNARNKEAQIPYIWADALCINQADDDEKAIQVGQMDHIYRKSLVVVSHLGSESSETDQALETCINLSIGWQTLLASCRRDDGKGSARDKAGIEFDDNKTRILMEHVGSWLTGRCWSTVEAFLSLPYWTRIWIIQEIALGREILLVLGNSTMTWQQLVDAREFCLHVAELLDGLSIYQSVIWDKFKPSTSLNWESVDLIRRFKGEGDKYMIMEGKAVGADSLKVLASASTKLATNPRDILYGLLGICRLPIKPDYKESVKGAYAMFAFGCIMGQLHNVILWAGTGLGHAPITGLPSWIPNWESISETGWRHPIDPERYNADGWLDPFPGSPPPGSPILGAALRIHGRTCDTVFTVKPALISLRSRQIFQVCQDVLRELGGGDNLYKTGIPVFQALMRTLYLDYEFHEFSRKVDYAKDADTVIVRVLSFLPLILPEDSFNEDSRAVLRDRLKELGIDPGFPFAQTLKANFWPSGKFGIDTEIDFSKMSAETILRDYPYFAKSPEDITKLQASPPRRRQGVDILNSETGFPIGQQLEVRICSWIRAGYRLFSTQSGYIGIGPPGMQEADVVCVLRRCTTPVLLRRAGESDKAFKLVGSCFVLGLMDGEASVTIESEIDDSCDSEGRIHIKLVDSAVEFLIE